MASTPKSSLVERLVQDRLRSGELEASAAHLLQLGEGAPGDATRLATAVAPPDITTGDAGMNLLVRPPPIVALRGTSLPGTSGSEFPATSSPAPATPAPISRSTDHTSPDAMALS